MLTHPEGGTLVPLGDGGGGFDGPDIWSTKDNVRQKNLKSFALTDARQNDTKINKFAISIITSSVAVPDILSASSISSLDNPVKKN